MKLFSLLNGFTLQRVLAAGLAAALLLPAPVVRAEQKKDVTDPVLQEIIASFSMRMPRFVDKHGRPIFVSDEQITRGSLMLALYEYDKSLKPAKKEFVTRQEFEELSSKLSLLAGTRGTDKTADKQQEKKEASYDKMQIINDLMPNMPFILDNSLNSSKVFASLKQEVLAQQASGIPGDTRPAAIPRSAVSRQEYDALSMQVSALALKVNAAGAADAGTPAAADALEKLATRVQSLEQNTKAAAASSRTAVSRQEYDVVRAQVEDLTLRLNSADSTAAAGRSGGAGAALAPVLARLQALEQRDGAVAGKDARGAVTRQEYDDLHAQVERLAARAGANASSTALADRVSELSRKVEALDTRQFAPAKPADKNVKNVSETETQDVRRRLAQLEQRVTGVERDTRGSEPGDVQRYGSVLTRVSLGLGMVAAFFMAR